jgi:hypothetical protein
MVEGESSGQTRSKNASPVATLPELHKPRARIAIGPRIQAVYPAFIRVHRRLKTEVAADQRR